LKKVNLRQLHLDTLLSFPKAISRRTKLGTVGARGSARGTLARPSVRTRTRTHTRTHAHTCRKSTNGRCTRAPSYYGPAAPHHPPHALTRRGPVLHGANTNRTDRLDARAVTPRFSRTVNYYLYGLFPPRGPYVFFVPTVSKPKLSADVFVVRKPYGLCPFPFARRCNCAFRSSRDGRRQEITLVT